MSSSRPIEEIEAEIMRVTEQILNGETIDEKRMLAVDAEWRAVKGITNDAEAFQEAARLLAQNAHKHENNPGNLLPNPSATNSKTSSTTTATGAADKSAVGAAAESIKPAERTFAEKLFLNGERKLHGGKLAGFAAIAAAGGWAAHELLKREENPEQPHR